MVVNAINIVEHSSVYMYNDDEGVIENNKKY